jgi:hypothetical protein
MIRPHGREHGPEHGLFDTPRKSRNLPYMSSIFYGRSERPERQPGSSKACSTLGSTCGRHTVCSTAFYYSQIIVSWGRVTHLVVAWPPLSSCLTVTSPCSTVVVLPSESVSRFSSPHNHLYGITFSSSVSGDRCIPSNQDLAPR